MNWEAVLEQQFMSLARVVRTNAVKSKITFVRWGAVHKMRASKRPRDDDRQV